VSVELFHKREIFIRGLELSGVDLDEVARVVARELGLAEHEVLVVDARDDLLTLDVLNPKVDVERIAGRERALLETLATIPGVRITAETQVHSEGVLGLLSVGPGDAARLPAALAAMTRDVRSTVARRAVVLPTGNEIAAGQVADANTPFLVELLRAEGFTVDSGPAIPDDVDSAIGRLSEAALAGHGLVVTSGGTGAESKDCIVEAIRALDPAAATPYVVRYQPGQGRHQKDGVRLAVGSLELTTYVALTGPHREVQLVAPLLVQGLREAWGKARLAEELARVLTAELAHRGGAHTSRLVRG
jgi:hypothetical protein